LPQVDQPQLLLLSQLRKVTHPRPVRVGCIQLVKFCLLAKLKSVRSIELLNGDLDGVSDSLSRLRYVDSYHIPHRVSSEDRVVQPVVEVPAQDTFCRTHLNKT